MASIISPDFRFVLRHPAHWIAFGLGSGLAPRAPGTVGSVMALPLYWLMAWFFTPTQILWLCIPWFVLGVWACHHTGRALQVADHGGIVIDEMVAMWLLLACFPASWGWQLAVLVVFRVFDILKPWPIGWVDRHVHGGLGVMLDDVLAALMAGLVLWPVQYWLVPG
jgi:phosphatidylglycerophosphatase A